MPVSAENLLLVEGEFDENFFKELCKDLSLSATVTVARPGLVAEGHYNSKQGVINLLPMLVNQLADGSLKRLAAVVDADFDPSSGFIRTLRQIENKLKDSKFTLAESDSHKPGLTFRHSDGLADLGIWIMPDNRGEGAAEDFLNKCVTPSEHPLFEHAKRIVHSLPEPKFTATHRSKAELATWLAWQRHPGCGARYALRNGLFEVTRPPFSDLTNWLRRIFG